MLKQVGWEENQDVGSTTMRPSMNFETIKFEKDNNIAKITINRPKALNALNRSVLTELGQCLNAVDEDNELRCLVITGEGDKAFVAGADIKEMENLSSDEAKEFSKLGQSVFRRLEILKIPVIAAVNGFALGGGLELAMGCDFMVASDNARFGLPEVSLGLIPGFGGTVRLSRYVGHAKAREMTYTAKHYKADAALAMGLVSSVVSSDELNETVMKMAKSIASQGPVAVSHAKLAINEASDLAVDAGMEMERSQFGALFATKDKEIGINAFLNKEKANFVGE